RFEPGGKAFSVVMALGASAKLLRETGIQNVEREAERLTRQLQEGLEARRYVVASPHGEKFRGAILNFVSGPGAKLRELAEIEKTFVTAKVAYAKRPPGIRLSLHAMMQDEDVARVLALL
ncbi:MAG: aminotransferase class V-fold PLP-dependent enzyme, partial [Bdellovibrionaceae bacterium]|nr:aminotransferase class V-fold PLP-dependent enzyme [Pseudobdellovibrionaceae bacterium]